MIGSMAEQYNDSVITAYNDGHYIANHAYSTNSDITYESADSVINEFNKTEEILGKCIGNTQYKSNLFRFPGGFKGSAGYSYRLEGLEIVLVKKGERAPGTTNNHFIQKYVTYSTHIQNIGWQEKTYDGRMSGTSGKSLRLEGIQIGLDNQRYSGDIEYRTHIQNIGWEKSYKRNNQMSGTSGRSLRLEAIQIRLTGEMAKKYDVYYSVHCQNFGWMGWAKNGESAGSAGYSYRLEGIKIVLVEKGHSAPGSTVNRFISK